MNLAVAAGWLRHCGLTKISPELIMQDESVNLHMKAAEWVERGAEGIVGFRKITVDCGECHNHLGVFLGRFLVVKMDPFWGNGLHAVAACVRTHGGDRQAGAAVLVSEHQVRLLCEDIGRALALPINKRLAAVRTVMGKWEGSNPPGWVNPLARPAGRVSLILNWIKAKLGRA